MKSFFKKLSLVLAAAMVITMLPLQSAKAATTTVGIGTRSGNVVTTGTSFTMEVGETQQWGFKGVTPYNQTAIATKKFTSDNTAVVTVAADKLTAVAAGIANITFTCSNGTTEFIGKATVTVKAAGAVVTNGTVKQDTYQSVVVTFATEDAAKAAVNKIKVERVKASTKGNFYLNVNTTQAQDKNTVKISGLSDQVTYRFTIPGQAKPEVVEMSVGVASDLILEYPTVYLGAGMDIVGNNVKNPTVTPIVKIVDANGIVTNEPVKNVKYTTDKTKNQYATFTAGSGKIKFSNLNGQCYVKATYTFKDAAGQSHTLTDDVTVTPVAYVAPSLQGFVEQICLTTKTGKDVVYPTDYSFSGSLAIGDVKSIAYFFETPEGEKYAGKNVKDTVVYDNGIKELNDKDYNLYFRKDDEKATVVSLYTYATKTVVRGWNEGTERICLYKQLGTSQQPLTDTLVGVIDITVQPEPYVFDMQLSDNSAEGFTNGIDTTAKLTYSLIDQYDNPIKGELVAKGTDGSSVASFVSIKAGDKTGEGTITIDFAKLGPTTEAKDVVVTVKGTEYSETISCSAEAIKTDSSDLGYDLIVKDLDVKNKNFINATAINALGVNFKVAETRDGNRLKYVDFIVTSDDIDETVAVVTVGTLVLVISNSDDQVVKADATKNIVTQGQGNIAQRINAPSSAGFTFDVYPKLADALTSIVGEELRVGSFTANLYKVTGKDSKGQFDLQSSVEFSVTNSMELIQNLDTTYKLKADDNKVKRTGTAATDLTWTSTDEGLYTVTSETQYKALMATIVGQLYGWYDFNSDGKATNDEVNAIKVLFPGFRVTDAKYVPGAENNEVFVKTITIKYPVRQDGNNLGDADVNGANGNKGSYAEQTLVINRKFKH